MKLSERISIHKFIKVDTKNKTVTYANVCLAVQGKGVLSILDSMKNEINSFKTQLTAKDKEIAELKDFKNAKEKRQFIMFKSAINERDQLETDLRTAVEGLKFVKEKIGLFACITPDDVLKNIRKSKRKILQIDNKITDTLERLSKPEVQNVDK